MSAIRTSEKIVDAATGLIKVRGYNAFSYQDVSELVGIRKASIHHHFSTKADLGAAVVRRFAQEFDGTLRDIEAAQLSGFGRITAFTELADGLVDRNEVCPCAMLASEAETLPDAVNDELRGYYDTVAGWLERALSDGRADGSINAAGDTQDLAILVLATVQGAAMTARCMKSRAAFDAAMRQMHLLLVGAAANG